jgi:DNA repair exonuclease SbcCD ATPase subunit
MAYFKFKSLYLDGFKSYQKPTIFNLDRQPGLYLISSVINGVGKSTLIDALNWVLVGKTVRGVKGKNVKGWNSKHCKVQVDFGYNDINQSLLRTHSPNTLILNNETIEQETLDTKLFTNVNSFIQTIIIGQFHTAFLELSPTERLNFFSEIVSLESWEDYSSKASEKVSLLSKEISKLEGQQISNKSILSGLKQQYGGLIKKNEQFETETKEKKIKLSELLQKAVSDYEIKEKELAELLPSLNLAKEDIKLTEQKIQDVSKQLTDETNILGTIKAEIKTLNYKVHEANKGIEKWKSLNQNCPYCLQSVSVEIVTTEKSKLIKEILQYNNELKQQQQNLEFHQDLYKTLNSKMLVEHNSTSIIKTNIGKLEIAISILSNHIQILKNDCNRYQIELQEEIKNPYTEFIIKHKYNITEYENSIIEIDKQIVSKQKDLRGYEFWIKGFKELRLWLTQDALLALEIETNNALEELNLVNWKMAFNITKENSTGGISKGLYIDIQSPFNPTPVPIEVWSGGQTQRLKLANTIGMIGLNQNYYGFDSNIEFWDEPSSFLSSEGIDRLIDLLAERARILNKVIFYIDHRALNKSKFDGIIKVTSENNISSIIEE